MSTDSINNFNNSNPTIPPHNPSKSSSINRQTLDDSSHNQSSELYETTESYVSNQVKIYLDKLESKIKSFDSMKGILIRRALENIINTLHFISINHIISNAIRNPVQIYSKNQGEFLKLGCQLLEATDKKINSNNFYIPHRLNDLTQAKNIIKQIYIYTIYNLRGIYRVTEASLGLGSHATNVALIKKNIFEAKKSIANESTEYLIKEARIILDIELDLCEYESRREKLFDLDEDIYNLEKDFICSQIENEKYSKNESEYYFYAVEERIKIFYRYPSYLDIEDIEITEEIIIEIIDFNSIGKSESDKFKMLNDLKKAKEIYGNSLANTAHEILPVEFA